MDEANVNMHRTILQDLRYYFPIEQYFFHIITYLFFDSILILNTQHNTKLRDFFNAEGINANCIIYTQRQHIKNLLNCIHVYFEKLYSNSDMADIWVKCYDIIQNTITDQMKTRILNETHLIYDEIYTKFSKHFYDGVNNTQEKNKDNIGIRFDRHALGALILVLLECKTDVDDKRSKISKELARDVMFGRKKLSIIQKKFKKLASTKASNTIQTTNNKTFNMKSFSEPRTYMPQPFEQLPQHQQIANMPTVTYPFPMRYVAFNPQPGFRYL